MSETLPTDYASLADEIAGWLRFQMDQVGASRLVLGLSGGIDSAVVCALSTMAAGPTRVIAAIMPIHSRLDDVRDAELVASTFEVVPRVIDLVPAHDALIAAMPGDGAPVWKTPTSTGLVSPCASSSRWLTSSPACA